MTHVEQSVEAVNQATDLAGQSGQSLQRIVSLVDLAADQVRSIATAAEEQSAASEEIRNSLADVNQVSGETSDTMRQSSLDVANLADQAQALRALIENMRCAGGHDVHGPAAAQGLKRLDAGRS